MIMSRKAQAAMEFLMTYGWAIMVVLIVIGALAYFGVLNPSSLVPERCSLTIPFDCRAASATDAGFGAADDIIALSVYNVGTRDLTVTQATFSSDLLSADCVHIPATPYNINSGSTDQETIASVATDNCEFNNNAIGRKAKIAVEILYNYNDAPGIINAMNGEIVAAVQG